MNSIGALGSSSFGTSAPFLPPIFRASWPRPCSPSLSDLRISRGTLPKGPPPCPAARRGRARGFS
eukprot:5865345-Pyramimonas_sp.AAC.1